MADPRNIIKKKQEITWAEVDVPAGHKTKSGKQVDMKAIIPDGEGGYGDSESVALMAEDTVTRHSPDTKAGDRAYETAKEQMDQDFTALRKKRKIEKLRSQIENAHFLESDGKIVLMYNKIDPDTGLMTVHHVPMDRDEYYQRVQNIKL